MSARDPETGQFVSEQEGSVDQFPIYGDLVGTKLTFNVNVDLSGTEGQDVASEGNTGIAWFPEFPFVSGLKRNQVAELVALVRSGASTRAQRIANLDETSAGTWRWEWEFLYDRDAVISDRLRNDFDSNFPVQENVSITEADYTAAPGFEERDPEGPLHTLDFGILSGATAFRDDAIGVAGGAQTNDSPPFMINFRDLTGGPNTQGRGPLMRQNGGRLTAAVRWDDVVQRRLNWSGHYNLYWDIHEFPEEDLRDVLGIGQPEGD